MADKALALAPSALPEVDRRSASRIRTVYRVARVRARGDEGLARVHNLSDEGMMLELGFPVMLNDTVRIDLTETVSLEGKVIWTEGGRCGLKLRRPVDSADLLRQMCEEQRSGATRPLRLGMRRPAMTASEFGLKPVSVVDISQRGMKLAHDGSFRPGLAVKVTTDTGIERRGVVRWTRDDLAGVILTEPFTVAELGSLRSWRSSRASSETPQAADPSS
ncbi:MAG: PilZ domain-containing protein [Sphingomonas sp.]|uniref:PilZ domain-containing protein n=1 Tax=Sphingomonas sp. TaxID=28214 RepID=UPI001AC7C891|nr:PilZ domain-containing protein [Sphingomonas sp.]MBN8816230.1 PilZ domain-containing protein [Sphingomonas sp.]